jgi:acid phosphatase family membrane protein YuiD
MLLEGCGFLLNAGRCSLITERLQLFPALQGEIQYTARSPEMFVQAIQKIVTAREETVLRQMSSLDGTKLEQLVTSISSHYMDADVNALLHMHDSS